MKFYQRLICIVFVFCVLFLVYYRYREVSLKINPETSKHESEINNDNKIPEKKIFTSKDRGCKSSYSTDKFVDSTFQPIHFKDQSKKGYVYSAYYDDRSAKQIVIISILDELSTDVQCVVWFSSNASVTVKGTVNLIPEGSGRRFTASYIYCAINTPQVPIYVSVIETRCDAIQNMLSVKWIAKSDPDRKFSVCVTPLNLNYNNVNQLIEMLSINELMGVSHVYFYNYSTGKDVDNVFNAYLKRNFVTIVPWHLPMKVHIWPIPADYVEEVKYFGQMAMLNDCLFRNMGQSKYVAFSDLDEYLIPRQHRNWHQLFDEIIARKYSSAKAWIFRNIFFKTEWPSDVEMARNATISSLHAMSLLKVRRERTIYPPFQRSKMIVDPLAIEIVGVHNVWKFHDNGGSDAVLDVDEGLCHHYRFWDGLGEKEYEIDRNIFRLREDLVGVFQKNRKILL